jgi:hypothetical protein
MHTHTHYPTLTAKQHQHPISYPKQMPHIKST